MTWAEYEHVVTLATLAGERCRQCGLGGGEHLYKTLPTPKVEWPMPGVCVIHDKVYACSLEHYHHQILTDEQARDVWRLARERGVV